MVIARGGDLLPGPFVDWLKQESARAGGTGPLAELLGVDESRVRLVVGCKGATGLVRLDTVDRWVKALRGDPVALYGPLWRVAVVPEREACGERCLSCDAPLREPAVLCGFCAEEGDPGHEKAPREGRGAFPSAPRYRVPAGIRSLGSVTAHPAGGNHCE